MIDTSENIDTGSDRPSISSEKVIVNYVELFDEAHVLREAGDDKGALENFTAAYELLDVLENVLDHEEDNQPASDADEGVERIHPLSDKSKRLDLDYKRATCRDQIFVRKAHLRYPKEKIIESIHEDGAFLVDLLEQGLEGTEAYSKEMSELIEELKSTLIYPASVLDVEKLNVCVKKIFNLHSGVQFEKENAMRVLTFYLYLSRWAYNIRDYFHDCSGQTQLTRAFEGLSRSVGEMGCEVRKNVQAAEYESDPVDRKIVNLSKWLKIYPYVQKIQNREGDFQAAIDAFAEIWPELQHPGDDSVYGDREYMQKIRISHAYALACRTPGGAMELMRLENEFKTDNPKILMRIKIAQMRSALRHEKIEVADFVLMQAKCLKDEHLAPHEKTSYTDQLMILEGRVELSKYLFNPHELDRGDTTARVDEVLDEGGRDKSYAPQLARLKRIENLFPSEELDDGSTKKLEFADTILEAERCLILGQIECERVQLAMADEYDEKSFESGRKYLLTAYKLLLEFGYVDPEFFSDIERVYEKLIDLNNTITGVSEERRRQILEKIDMEDAVHHFQLEEWANDFIALISEHTFSSMDACEAKLTDSLLPIVRRFALDVCEIQLLRQDEHNQLNGAQSYAHKVHQGAANEFVGHNAYPNGDGKYIVVLPLDTEERHSLVIESHHELADSAKKLIRKIASGVTKVLKIHSVYSRSGGDLSEADEDNLVELTNGVNRDLLRKDPDTIYHQINTAEICQSITDEVNEMYPKLALDRRTMLIAGLLHDIGKYIIRQSVLAKPAKPNKQEFSNIKQHPGAAFDVLTNGTLAWDKFEDAIITIGLHHLRDSGIRAGYPLDVKGEEFFTEIPKWIAKNVKGLTQVQRDDLMSRNLTLADKMRKDIIAFADIMQALTGKRAYRDGKAIDELAGYINRNIGRDFPYWLAPIIIGMINDGKLNRILSNGSVPDGVKHDFDMPVAYEVDTLHEYVAEMDAEKFKREFHLDYEQVRRDIKRHTGKNIPFSTRTIRGEMFQFYLNEYDLSQKETQAKYGHLCDKFVEEFQEWAGEPLSATYELDLYADYAESAA